MCGVGGVREGKERFGSFYDLDVDKSASLMQIFNLFHVVWHSGIYAYWVKFIWPVYPCYLLETMHLLYMQKKLLGRRNQLLQIIVHKRLIFLSHKSTPWFKFSRHREIVCLKAVLCKRTFNCKGDNNALRIVSTDPINLDVF